MNAKKFLAALVGVLMLMQCTAFAADISPEAVPHTRPELTSVEINQIGTKIYIDITAENVSNDQPVFSYICYGDETEGGYENGGYDNMFGYDEPSLVGVAYSPVNAGEAQLEMYPYTLRSGDFYYVTIALYNAGEVYQEKIFFVTEDDVTAFMATLKSQEDTEEVRNTLKEIYYAISVLDYEDSVKLVAADYEALSEEGKDAFIELIVNGVNGEYSAAEKSGLDYVSGAEFVKEAYLIAAYNEGGFSDSDLAEVIYTHADAVGINTADGSVFADIQNKDVVIKIAKTMMDEVNDADELAKVLEQAACVQIVNETHWLNLVNVIAENNDLFGVDEDELEELLNTKKLRNAFCEEFKGTYYSIDEIREAWEDAYKAAKKEVSSSTSSSSGGGGGGGNVKINTVSTQISDTENNYDPDVEILDYYTDMGEYLWASDAILNLTKKQIVSGYGDKTFGPANSLTRAEFMKMLVNVFGLADITATSSFTDVDKDAWYHVYIASAEKLGLAEGYGNGVFGVNDPVTRQDAVTLIYRVAKLKGLSLEKFTASIDGLKDRDTIAAYAVDAVSALYNAGVYLDASNPKSVDVFEPTRNATRAYACVLLNQVYIYMN